MVFTVVEWVGPTDGERGVRISFDEDRKTIHINDNRKKPLRMLDLRRVSDKSSNIHLRIANDGSANLMSVRIPNEIDLVKNL